MLSNLKTKYEQIFNIQEVTESKTLQLLYYCVTLSFFVTFYGWINSSSVSISNFEAGNNICPPYFPSCGNFYFLQDLPLGYSNGYFYILLFVILGSSVIFSLKNKWWAAHFTLLLAWLWKVVWIFFLTYGIAGNYDYYDIFLGFIILFLPNKLYFAKISFVFFYFIASTIKIDEGWIFGNYFNSLFTGAPLIPEYFVPFFTNLLIFMQIVGAWFLLSNNKILQRLTFIYFILFHIYSGFIVNYRYLTISLTALVALFGNVFIEENKKFELLKISKRTIAGYLFLLILLIGQMIGILIPGNQKKTLEGNYWGLFMFEAAHQCISTAVTERVTDTGEIKTQTNISENHIANNRCDPYMYWYRLRSSCNNDKTISKISWTFDHSINGHKYERIVDESNICQLEYKTFNHNTWIKINNEAQTIERPVYKMGYLDSLNNKKYNTPTIPYENPDLLIAIVKTYWYLWVLTLILIVSALFIRTSRK